MNRSEIEEKAQKQLSVAGRLIFAEAVRRGRLEPTKGCSGAICRLWIDWLQADARPETVVALYNVCRDVIGEHYGEYWTDNGRDNLADLVVAMDEMDSAFGLRGGQPVYGSKASDDAPPRDVDNETGKKAEKRYFSLPEWQADQ